jgi:hypothetical protein
METDCHALNDRFISWLQNEYMKSSYTESMDFSEYYWRYGNFLLTKWEAENGC